MKSLTYIEIDIQVCALTYGVAPCTAQIGVTGSDKCFNSLKTCQDRNNIDLQTQTLRFSLESLHYPKTIPAIPSLDKVSYTPAVVSLGEDLGTRASLSVSFRDHPWSDAGDAYDKYVTERSYEPFKQGTFWGKFRARQPFLRGRAIRLIRGFLGDDLADMETRHFVIDSFDGPDNAGNYTIKAKDRLKFADGDRAKAPAISTGELSAAITSSATSATLSPVGIGDAEYPASGRVNIGGNELCDFTRSGDALTLTRGVAGSVASAHDEEDKVQLCLVYDAQDPADIIFDLLTNYTEITAADIPLGDWQNETGQFLARLYSATIPEPTPVKDLVAELIEQCGLAVWWDDLSQEIKLQVLRSIGIDTDSFDADVIIAGSLKTKDQPEKRLSQVWVYYGQINPVEQQDERQNYRSVAVSLDLQSQTDHGGPAIKEIFSRWINQFNRTAALRVGEILLSRFADPPRRINFSVMRPNWDVMLGAGYCLGARPFQDEFGAAAVVPIQVTRVKPEADRFEAEAEEMLFTLQPGLPVGTVLVDNDVNNLNLRTAHDSIYPAPTDQSPAYQVTLIVASGVTIGSDSISLPALDIGTWPSSVLITLQIEGRVQGKGGNGGNGGGRSPPDPGGAGEAGGTAILTARAIEIDSPNGEIFGGGGGGGGGGANIQDRGGDGGGGAGREVGLKGTIGSPGAQDGTADAGGNGGLGNNGSGDGGSGGDPGQAGASGQTAIGGGSPQSGGSGGAAGNAIDGISHVTATDLGDIRGPQIN